MLRVVLASIAIFSVLVLLETIEGPSASGSPLDQTLIQFPTFTPTRTPTRTTPPTPTSVTCGTSAAVSLTNTRLFQGDSTTARGVGFMPNSSVHVRLVGPDGVDITSVLRSSDSSCQVLAAFTTSSQDRLGRYRVIME